MDVIASHFTGHSIVCSNAYSGYSQRYHKYHKNITLLALYIGDVNKLPVDSTHKAPEICATSYSHVWLDTCDAVIAFPHWPDEKTSFSIPVTTGLTQLAEAFSFYCKPVVFHAMKDDDDAMTNGIVLFVRQERHGYMASVAFLLTWINFNTSTDK